MVFWSIGLQKLGATTAGILMNFNPVFTVILAFIFLGEKMNGSQVVGALIVIPGCYLFTYFKDKKLIRLNVTKQIEGYR